MEFQKDLAKFKISMSLIYIDILFCIITYAILMGIILWQKQRNPPSDGDNDDDGGMHVWTEPDLDLPPGVCLPTDGPTIRKEELVE